MRQFIRNNHPGILCALVILVLTGLPGSSFPKIKPIVGFDKLIHILMYLGFTLSTLIGYRKPYRQNGKAYRRKAIWIVLTIGIAYGALTEIMQETLVPTRTGSVYDWIADTIGSTMGVLIFYFSHQNGNNLKNKAFIK